MDSASRGSPTPPGPPLSLVFRDARPGKAEAVTPPTTTTTTTTTTRTTTTTTNVNGMGDGETTAADASVKDRGIEEVKVSCDDNVKDGDTDLTMDAGDEDARMFERLELLRHAPSTIDGDVFYIRRPEPRPRPIGLYMGGSQEKLHHVPTIPCDTGVAARGLPTSPSAPVLGSDEWVEVYRTELGTLHRTPQNSPYGTPLHSPASSPYATPSASPNLRRRVLETRRGSLPLPPTHRTPARPPSTPQPRRRVMLVRGTNSPLLGRRQFGTGESDSDTDSVNSTEIIHTLEYEASSDIYLYIHPVIIPTRRGKIIMVAIIINTALSNLFSKVFLFYIELI